MNPVLFSEVNGQGGDIGVITLNRPQALNSLNLPMILEMRHHLEKWAQDKTIKAVMITAVPGRAFCAGGDIKAIYEKVKTQDPAGPEFFRIEYALNALIQSYPKPYIAYLDGITMGGGAGISIHGRYRLGTERMTFAMPETGIGFFPDVGGTYFLSRLKHEIGTYLGLTGARINADDCLALNLITHKIKADQFPAILSALADLPFTDNEPDAILTPFLDTINPSTLAAAYSDIMQSFAFNEMEAIMAHLQTASAPLLQQAFTTLLQKSPSSLKVTLRALRLAAQLDFNKCMQQEFRLACHFLKSYDFPEGIRAVVVDKDQMPAWSPPSLNLVTKQDIEHYFKPISQELSL